MDTPFERINVERAPFRAVAIRESMPDVIFDWVRNPHLSLAALVQGTTQVQLGWLQVPSEPDQVRLTGDRRDRAARVLRDSAEILELHQVLCAIFEAEESIDCVGQPAKPERALETLKIVHALTGLDPVETLQKGVRFLPTKDVSAAGKVPPYSPEGLEADLLRISSTAVSSCDIRMIENLAEAVGRQALAHRCRLATDWLRSFIFRRGVAQGTQIKAAGVAYAQGRLSVEEVAAVVCVSVDEALFLLERYGYFRPSETVRLTNQQRKEKLARLRDDRLRRRGEPQADQRAILRDVVSSHRIEDLDARPWLPTEKTRNS